MPQQKRQVAGNKPISFRPGALQRERLNQLIEQRGQHQTAVLNAAIDLLWLLDCGYDQLQIKLAADLLTDGGKNDPEI
ncbi:MAG: hypothetical protein C4589_00315 [Peptococcaceae bacterium]|jgi:hypothetical protein|nr:MAG: hypothetical protein C4589_00315 [Peptococcaceae bacterium]